MCSDQAGRTLLDGQINVQSAKRILINVALGFSKQEFVAETRELQTVSHHRTATKKPLHRAVDTIDFI